jgi:large repetitive protein
LTEFPDGNILNRFPKIFVLPEIMRSGTRLFLSLLLSLLFCSTAFAQGAKVSTENPAESQRDRPQERANWFMRGRMVDGKPGAEQLHRAYDQKLNNRRLQGLARAAAAQGTTGNTTASPRPLFVPAPPDSPPWNFLGPAPTATAAFSSTLQDYSPQQNYGPAIGRVTAVAVDQGDTSGKTVYIGGASGGLWKTTNADAARFCDSNNGVCTAPVTWTPLTDGQATLTVGSIALQPGNSSLILVGTGEANNSADSYYGLGILRSTDAGATWSLTSSATCLTSNPACPSSGTVSFHGLGFTHIAFSTDNAGTLTTSTVVATAAAASGGITVGAEIGDSSCPTASPSCPRGIYYSTDAGVTWTRATVSDGTTSPAPASANAVIYNSAEKKFFANLRYHGFYSSSDGANWTRLLNQPANITLLNCPSSPASSGCPLYRAEMAIVPGRDEMYVWIYNSSENDIGIYQTKNGGQTWTQISTTGIDTCFSPGNPESGCGNDPTGQGTYNITLAAVPNGGATDLYAGGVNEYKCTINSATNPTCTTSPFLNLTHVYGCSPTANIAHVHPDEHGVDFLGNDGTGAFFASQPSGYSPPIFFGNDGGVYRVLQGSSLTNGTCPAQQTPPFPPSPFDNLNSSTGFSMIQFVGFSHHPSDPTTLVGGTQDNGSPAVSSSSPSSSNWLQVNRGDGGFNAINPLNANEWFTSNPAPLVAGGGIQRCTNGIQCTFNPAATPPGFATVVSQNQILGDNSSFYTFFTLDPQASTRMFVASCRAWRGNSDGSQSSSLGGNWSVLVNGIPSGGNPLSQNFDTGVTGAGATCGDPYPPPPATATFMVNTIAAGGPCNGTCDPGATPGTSSGGGSQVVWAGMEGIADSVSAQSQCLPGNGNGTPCGGQVWVTIQADADLSTTPNKWTEVSGLGTGSTPATSADCTSTPSVCNINPKHYTISGIALDPHDSTGKTAYVTVMGFSVGHIFKTTDAGATWAMLDGNPSTTGLPDAPADAVVTPPASAIVTYPTLADVVYVGTDVGVFQSTGNGTWTELGPSSGAGSLPNVTITQLKIYNNPSDAIPLRLRASTYGRGIWEIPISPSAGYTMAISNPDLFAFAGQTATYNGSITAFNGYTNSINITCTSGATAPPSTCPTSGSPVTVNSGGFTVTAGNATFGDFSFNITAVGSDLKAFTQQSPVTFHAVDFSLGAVSGPATVGQGDTADVNFTVSAQGQYTGNVTLSCSGIAECATATFLPAVVSLTPGVTANVELTIPTSSSTTLGLHSVTITGTGALGTATQVHTTPQPFSLTVTSASQAFTVAAAGAISPFKPTQAPNPTGTVNLTAGNGYTGTLALSCAFDANAGSPGASTCNLNPTSVTLAGGQTLPSTLTVTSAGAVAANPRVIVTARDAATNASNSANFNYSVVDYSVSPLTTPAAIVPNGAPASVGVTLTALNGYTGTVAATCNVASPVTCVLSPAGPYTPNSGATPVVTATITAPTNTPGGTYTVNVNTNDAAVTTLTHNQSVSVSVQDFSPPSVCSSTSPTGTCSTSATVTAGGTATFNILVAAAGGFSGTVSFDPAKGGGCTNLPSLTTCTFVPVSVNPGGSSLLTIQTTAPSVSQLRLPAARRTAPLYALWLTMPGMVVGIIGMGVARRNRRGKLLRYIGLAVVLGILLTLASCGGGGGGSTTPPPIPKPGTPAGTYQITVTGASGSGATALSHHTLITLTVN